MAVDDENLPSSERSPLLGQHHGSSNGRVVDPEDVHGPPAAADEQHDGTGHEEPSSTKLVVIMTAIWIGVFFAALGMLSIGMSEG